MLITEGGKDATEAFEDVGHSDDARALLPPMLVGELEGAEVSSPSSSSRTAPRPPLRLLRGAGGQSARMNANVSSLIESKQQKVSKAKPASVDPSAVSTSKCV